MMKTGDKVRIHPQINKFDKHQHPTISPDMLGLAGKEGTIIDTVRSTSRYPELYRVRCYGDIMSYYYRGEWLVAEDEIEISVNSQDIQNLLL